MTDGDINLWPFQAESVDQLRAGIRAGRRKQILMSPTGSGKTEIACYLVKEATRKMSRVVFLVDRINLCDQTSARFDKYGIKHGVMQAGHWRDRSYERVQVCSAQTVEKRGFPPMDLLIVDEAHCLRKATAERITATNAVVLGLTATPFTKGLGQVYDSLVNVTTTNKLIEDGYLCPLRMYAAKSVDMTGAKVVAGEWAESEIEKRGTEIIGDIVSEWADKTRQHFGGPVKTIVFSATVDHGAEICKHFQEAGFNFQQVSYKDTNDQQRRDLIEEFRKPNSTIHGLVSCEVFTKGFDVPDLLCGISARPYRKSLSSHIQQLGRVMRRSEGKTFGIWLDHSGNVLRFYKDTQEIFENGMQALDDGEHDAKARKELEAKDKSAITCACGCVLSPHQKACPSCGKEIRRRSLIETLPGEMVEVNGLKASQLPEWMRDRTGTWQQLCTWAVGKKSGDVEAARKLALAKYRAWYGEWPPIHIGFQPTQEPGLELYRRIKHDTIKWAKGQQAARRTAHA